MPEYINYVASPTVCTPDMHAFYVYGDPPPDSMDGLPCQCGKMISLSSTCPTCGHKTYTQVPREEYEKSQEEPLTVWDKNLSRYVEGNKETGGLVS